MALLFSKPIFSQSTQGVVLKKEILRLNKEGCFSKYDSLILCSSYGYWSKGIRVQGIGFVKDNYYRLIITTKIDSDGVTLLKVKRKRNCFFKKKMKKTDVMDFSRIKVFNDDSLNLQLDPVSNLIIKVSDGLTFYLMHINNSFNEITIKRSYKPKYYQNIVNTNDRSEFIKMYDWLEF